LSFPEAGSLQPGGHITSCNLTASIGQTLSARAPLPCPWSPTRPPPQPAHRRPQRHLAPPGSVDHQRKGDSTLGATVPLGPYRRPPPVHNGPAPPRPLALAAHGHRPETPGHPLPLRQAPFTCPPLPAPGGKCGDGTPVPPWSRCPVRKFFQKINLDKIGNMPPWLWDPAPKFLYAKYVREAGPSGADFWPCVRAPLLTPWFAPYRGFLAPMMTLSPFTITFFPWVGGAIWAGRRIDDLAQHSSRATHFTLASISFSFPRPRLPRGFGCSSA
jgi:hypothetical protein